MASLLGRLLVRLKLSSNSMGSLEKALPPIAEVGSVVVPEDGNTNIKKLEWKNKRKQQKAWNAIELSLPLGPKSMCFLLFSG